MKSTLITGGARSGKSRYAQEMATATEGGVLFVATAEAGDEEMKQRIEEHRRSRPSGWKTLEATESLGHQIIVNTGDAGTVIIDCITMLVNNVIMRHGGESDTAIENAVMAEVDGIIGCLNRLDARFIIVTNEVGLGIVPGDRVSRRYRDLLGKANQRLAEHVDEVILMVAGLPVRLKPG